jgi:Transposase DDE domain
MLWCIPPIFKIGMVACLFCRPCSACTRFYKSSLLMADIQGPVFQNASAKILPHLQIEIVKRSDQAKGFELLPRRWVVERTFAWLNRCRRLAKDFENLTRTHSLFSVSPQFVSRSESFV